MWSTCSLLARAGITCYSFHAVCITADRIGCTAGAVQECAQPCLQSGHAPYYSWCKPPKNFVTECRLRNKIFQRIAHAIEKGSSSALSVDTSTWGYGDGDQSQLKESREANIVDYIWGELEGGANETTHVEWKM
jgi:hypothetical protein